MPRHRHNHGYVSLILSGGYEETGDRGRFHVEAGDVLLHSAFDAHLNRFAARDAAILNLELPWDYEPAGSLARIPDPDFIANAAVRDPREAVSILLEDLELVRHESGDWPELLAFDLARDPSLSLGHWATAHRLAAATLSRGFHRVFGLSPASFRAEIRAREAWRRIMAGASRLADLAQELGFSDQAHMSRAVRAITGRPPGQWNRGRSNRFKI
jgi:AraC-like DNA-binding protein